MFFSLFMPRLVKRNGNLDFITPDTYLNLHDTLF